MASRQYFVEKEYEELNIDYNKYCKKCFWIKSECKCKGKKNGITHSRRNSRNKNKNLENK